MCHSGARQQCAGHPVGLAHRPAHRRLDAFVRLSPPAVCVERQRRPEPVAVARPLFFEDAGQDLALADGQRAHVFRRRLEPREQHVKRLERFRSLGSNGFVALVAPVAPVAFVAPVALVALVYHVALVALELHSFDPPREGRVRVHVHRIGPGRLLQARWPPFDGTARGYTCMAHERGPEPERGASEAKQAAGAEEAPAGAPGRQRGPAGAGSIELIIGPMFSEKSTEMISRVRRAALARQPAVIVKHRDDARYAPGAVVATHADVRQASTPGSEASAPIRVVAAGALAEVEAVEPVVGVDEGQFYPDLVEACERWAGEGRRVVVAALDGDFARRPFGQVCALVPLCEQVEKRRGVCMTCRRRESAFTLRLGPGTALIDVGAQEKYQSVCRACYRRLAAVPPTPEPGAAHVGVHWAPVWPT